MSDELTKQTLAQARGDIGSLALDQYLKVQMRWFLGFDDVDEVCAFVLELPADEMCAYVRRLLADANHRRAKVDSFLNTLLSKKREEDARQAALDEARHPERIKVPTQESGVTVYRKHDGLDQDIAREYGSAPAKAKKRNRQREKAKERQRAAELAERERFESRVACECQASRHELVGNCLRCGKVICAKEGSGPCLFCAEFLGVRDAAVTRFHDASGSAALGAAIAQKNQLLLQDRAARHAKVIDDQMDFYETDLSWMSADERKRAEQRQEAREQAEHDARHRVTLTFDLAGRRVVESDRLDDDEHIVAAIDRQIEASSSSSASPSSSTASSSSSEWSSRIGIYRNPFLNVEAPRFVETSANKATAAKDKATKRRKAPVNGKRIQHNEQEEIASAFAAAS
jgi:Putative zinc finger motif, C2HC5-type